MPIPLLNTVGSLYLPIGFIYYIFKGLFFQVVVFYRNLYYITSQIVYGYTLQLSQFRIQSGCALGDIIVVFILLYTVRPPHRLGRPPRLSSVACRNLPLDALVGYSLLRLCFFRLNRLRMLLYANKVDKASLLLLLSLLMNLLSKYSKCLRVCLDVVFRRFLYTGLLRKDQRIQVLVVLGGFIL